MPSVVVGPGTVELVDDVLVEEVLVDVDVDVLVLVDDVLVDVELVDVELVEVDVELVEVDVDVEDVEEVELVDVVTLDGRLHGVVSVTMNVRWWHAARISSTWLENAMIEQFDVMQFTGVDEPWGTNDVCTVKLTGTLSGSLGVTGLSNGPKFPFRPVVNGVEAALHSVSVSLHCRRTPVWLPLKRVPSTETTCPSLSASLGVTLIWGSKKCGSFGSLGSVGSNVVAKAVPTSAAKTTTTTAVKTLFLARSRFIPAFSDA